MIYDTIVVGNGIFGAVLSRHLRNDLGQKVVTIDDHRSGAGSKPAACLMKPSWFSTMGDKADRSLELLDHHYGVRDIRFRVGPLHATVHWVPPSLILSQDPSVWGTVLRVRPGYVDYRPRGEQGEVTLAARRVVVATGVWAAQLLKLEEHQQVVAQAGAAHRYRGFLDEPFIRPWAPYKQMVAFNREPGHIWVGDGAAIKPENWDVGKPSPAERNRARCDEAASGRPFVETLFGYRPYVSKAKPCLVEEVATGLWVLTGGAKNGTIAAGWAAHHLGEIFK